MEVHHTSIILISMVSFYCHSQYSNCHSQYSSLIIDAIRRDIYTNETSASFEIPENLHNNQSLQWVWSKDDNIQCVCPPVEQFMSQCACNIENPNSNTISISNNHIFITNLHQDNGMGEVILHVISSVSSGCLRTCNLKSIVAVYRIVIATQGTMFNLGEAKHTYLMYCYYRFSSSSKFKGHRHQHALLHST